MKNYKIKSIMVVQAEINNEVEDSLFLGSDWVKLVVTKWPMLVAFSQAKLSFITVQMHAVFHCRVVLSQTINTVASSLLTCGLLSD